MKYVFQFIALVLLAFVGKASASDLSLGQYTSPEGNAFTLITMPGQSDVFIKTAWPSDWAYRQGVNPAVPFIGRRLLLAGGAEGWKPSEANETFKDLRANADLAANTDHVYGGLFVKKNHLMEALRVVNAHLRAPLLDQRVLSRLLDDMKSREKLSNEQPWTPIHETASWVILGDTPLRRDRSLLTDIDIDGVTVSDIRGWHQSIFAKGSAKIALAGDLSVEAAGEAVDALFRGLPDHKHVFHASANTNFAPRLILIHRPDQQATRIELLTQLPPTKDGGASDEISNFILTSALAGGQESVLFNAIRSELHAAYSVSPEIFNYSQYLRILALKGEVDPVQLSKVKDTILQAYNAFRENGPDGDLAARKTSFYAVISKSHEQPVSLANSALGALLDEHPPENVLHFDKELEKITPETLKARLAKAFPPKEAFIIIASSPDANALPGACVIKEPSEAINCH